MARRQGPGASSEPFFRPGDQGVSSPTLWEIAAAAQKWRSCDCTVDLASGDWGTCEHEVRLIRLTVEYQIEWEGDLL